MKMFMIVDDAPVIRKVANRILSDLGFAVVEAADGFDALEKCRYSMPEVLIVDWDMPKMSGIEFIEEFRRIEGNEQTKLVYCTSEIMVSEMTRAKRAGANGFLMKPFNREILIHKIQEVGIEIADKDSQAA
ncbi:MAG: response regulator [Rhizobiaceae bacterium]|jgi:two-component system chemotaxis response regulator CheY|nr:response regulator [Rhizobiaceae bacterium]